MKLVEKNKPLKFTILVRNNKTNKHKSFRIDCDEDEDELLDLIKKLLKEHYYLKKIKEEISKK